MPWHVHTFKSHLNSKQGNLIFLLFGSWSLVRSSHPEVFLEILQNSQENTCARVSFLIKLGKKKRLWHRYFHVSFAKFLRAAFLIEHVWWLLLFSIASSCLIKIKVSPITPNLTFNVCMKTVNEFCVSNGAKWLSNRLWNKWLWNWLLLQLLKL